MECPTYAAGNPSLDYPNRALNVALPRHERTTAFERISDVKLLLLTFILPSILISFVTYSQLNSRINGQGIVDNLNIKVRTAFQEI